MDEQVLPADAEDAAWATLNTPLTTTELKIFCQDIERLYRINPLLEFKQWQVLGNNHFLLNARNISQQPPFDFETEILIDNLPDGFQVKYSQGIKTSTTFRIEAAPQGSKLIIIDRYDGSSEEDRNSRLNEVDKSIVVWASYLQNFLISWRKWSKFSLWRWYMRRIWQPMKPSSRRITYMLLWISFVEVALIALGAAIYFVEYA